MKDQQGGETHTSSEATYGSLSTATAAPKLRRSLHDLRRRLAHVNTGSRAIRLAREPPPAPTARRVRRFSRSDPPSLCTRAISVAGSSLCLDPGHSTRTLSPSPDYHGAPNQPVHYRGHRRASVTHAAQRVEPIVTTTQDLHSITTGTPEAQPRPPHSLRSLSARQTSEASDQRAIKRGRWDLPGFVPPPPPPRPPPGIRHGEAEKLRPGLTTRVSALPTPSAIDCRYRAMTLTSSTLGRLLISRVFGTLDTSTASKGLRPERTTSTHRRTSRKGRRSDLRPPSLPCDNAFAPWKPRHLLAHPDQLGRLPTSQDDTGHLATDATRARGFAPIGLESEPARVR